MEEKTIQNHESAVEDIWESLKNDINDALNELEKEEFRWLRGLNLEDNKQCMVLQGFTN